MFYLSEPIFDSRPWGGEDLLEYYPTARKKDIGEVWLLSGLPGRETKIFSPDGKEYYPSEKIKEITGMKLDRFPFLIKVLKARQWLSVQVHPDDEYARENESEPWGKNELWYVLGSQNETELIDGIVGVSSPEEFKEILKSDNLEKYLHKKSVKEGDLIDLKAGKVHALGPDALIFEVQQTSDMTYRLFDWGRPREIHVEKAAEVTDYKMPVSHNVADAQKYENPFFKVKVCKESEDEIIRGFSVIFSLEDIFIGGFHMKKYFTAIIPEKDQVVVKGSHISIQMGKEWSTYAG